MILSAVQRAFNRDNAPPTSAEPKKVAVRKGGLEVIYHVKVGESLCCVAKAPVVVKAPSRRLAAATDEGDVVFLDAADGTVCARCGATDEPPNAMAFTQDGKCLVSVSDDGIARVMDESGALLFAHAVVEAPAAGKRARCVAADHLIALASGGFVAAAGRLIHTCGAPGADPEQLGFPEDAPSWQLEHALVAEAPIRALCGAPLEMPAGCAYWAYAAAHKGGIMLVCHRGEAARLTQSAPLPEAHCLAKTAYMSLARGALCGPNAWRGPEEPLGNLASPSRVNSCVNSCVTCNTGEVVGKLTSVNPLRSLAMPLASRGMGPEGEPRWLAHPKPEAKPEAKPKPKPNPQAQAQAQTRTLIKVARGRYLRRGYRAVGRLPSGSERRCQPRSDCGCRGAPSPADLRWERR